MAFFALLDPPSGENGGDYCVKRCHINVWSLPGWFGHRPMAFDVGVLLEPQGNEDLTRLEMALPVRTAPRVIDLSDTFQHAGVGALLFGKTFVGNSNHKLQLKLHIREDSDKATDVAPLSVNAKRSRLDGNDRELTVAKLAFDQPAERGRLSYLRVRFVVDHAGNMWRWQRVLGRRNGVLIDFRAPDPREESQKRRRHIEGRAKEIGELDAFFMLPERFRLQSSNPELKYTRTLEGKAWDPYLRRSLHGLSAHRGSHQRLMVHRWHPETGGSPKRINRDHPFRGFLQFNREPAFHAHSDLALVALLTAIVFFALFRPLTFRAGIADVADWVGDRVSDLVGLGVKGVLAAGVFAVIFAAWKVVQSRRDLPAAFGKLKRVFKRVEYEWFGVLRGWR